MSDTSPPTWTDLETFLAEDPRRRRSGEPTSFGNVTTAQGPSSSPERWELLWIPETGELIEHRAEANPGVRLIGVTHHHDYIQTEIADLDRRDKDAQVHHRRWEATHPRETPTPRPGWRSRHGSSALQDALARWQELMDGTFPDDVNENYPLDDWGHTVDHVTGPFKVRSELWDMLLPTAVAAANEALQLERDLRGPYNLAAAANLASELRVSAEILHKTLIEAYGVAHREHPGKQPNA